MGNVYPEDTLVTSHQGGQLTLISEARTTLPVPLEYTLQHLGVIEKPLSLQIILNEMKFDFYSRCNHRKSGIETIGLQNHDRDECHLIPKPAACRAQKSVGF